MPTSARTLPGACRDHVDEINKALAAGDDDRAFYLAYQYFRARAKHIQARRREQDADGFRRYATHWLADLAGQIHDHKPDDDYRLASPLISGGDWCP